MNDNRNEMNKIIKNAFNSVHAEESLKNETINFINSKRKSQKSIAFKLVPVMSALIIVFGMLVFGYNLYSTPVTAISIDTNHSIELGINRFDKVVTISSFNEDGTTLENEIDVKHCSYSEAIKRISEAFESDEGISITVAGKEGKQKIKIISDIEKFTEENKSVNFDKATKKEVKEAHEKGLSFGKYKAYLRLLEDGCEITEEEIKDMSMKDINEKRKNHRNESQCDSKDEFQSGEQEGSVASDEQTGLGNGNHSGNKPNKNGNQSCEEHDKNEK